MSEKRNCDIAQDLIPLEVDGVCTEGSKEFLQEHISQCDGCRRLYDLAKSGTWQKKKEPFREDAALRHSMKQAKRKFRLGRLLLVFLSLIVLVYGWLIVWNQLMRYQTSIPVNSYSAYVYAQADGPAYVLAHMPYSRSNVSDANASYTLLTADSVENTTGMKNAYIIELTPKYNVFAEKTNMRRYETSQNLGGSVLELKDGHLYTASKYADGFVPGVPVAEVRICDDDGYRTIYTWGDDVLTFEGVVPDSGESAIEYNGVIPEIPKG